MVSLFTDRRIKEDELEAPERDRKGWWGDIALENSDDQIGSRLWLLDRAKATENTRALVDQYVLECLQWLLDDGVAEEVNIESVLIPRSRIDFSVEIKRPKERDRYFYRYQLVWEGQKASIRKVN
jgi:phage gp46-like protein